MKSLTIHNKSSVTVTISYTERQNYSQHARGHGTIYNIPKGESISFPYGLGNWARIQKEEFDTTVRLITLPTDIEAFHPQPWQKKARRKGLFNHIMYIVIKE